jgi:uncharacterized membrane protein YpjA
MGAKSFMERRRNAVALAVVGFLASAAGLWFYWPQLVRTPAWLWVFVADCPLYVSLFSVLLLLRLTGRGYPFLDFVTSVGMAKYGIWTIAVILAYPVYMVDFPMFLFLLGSHAVMIAAGLLLIPYTEPRLGAAALVTGWFLLNDLVDYFGGTLPRIPEGHVPEIMAVSMLSSVLLPLIIVRFRSGWWGRRSRSTLS